MEVSKAINDADSVNQMKLHREEKEMMDAGTCGDLEMKSSDILYVTFNDESLDDAKM